MDKIVWAGQIFWVTFGVAAVIACLLSSRSRRAMLIARALVGMVMLVGGALLNTAYLLAGNDYSLFMDASWFPWVTETWRAVVPPNHVLLIGLLILFEAAVGVLILSGGRMTQLGLGCAIAFHLALCVMGVGRDVVRTRDAGRAGPAAASGAMCSWRTGPSPAEAFGAGPLIAAPYAMAPATIDRWARSSRRNFAPGSNLDS
jgi:hypothetical protein